MNPCQTYYIGLMSGTSADSIDGVLVDFGKTKPRILATHSQTIPTPLRTSVFDLAIPNTDEINTISHLDAEYGHLFCKAVFDLCQQAGINTEQITAIGSHGQTVRHRPPSTKQAGYSLQIGDPNIIAEQTGVTTVADFRRRDIAAGGHGAPLAPGLHHALFRSEENSRFILNAGGIANITFLPSQRPTLGFDTGPANGLMDAWCQSQLGEPFDRNGAWALSGKTCPALLKRLLQHPYFQLAPPKSTGREDFNSKWLQECLTKHPEIAPEDVQSSLLELTTESISQAINALDPNNDSEIFICGGGAHNMALYQRLATRLSPRQLATTEALGIHPDWVEAVAFAWLAKLTMEHKTGNLPTVTGADRATILGGIYLARR